MCKYVIATYIDFSALKIHMSEHTQRVLSAVGNFEIELRGEVEMKVGSV